jgi:hypothetical protein
MISGTRRITIDNTLDERLRLLEDRVCVFHCLLSHCSSRFLRRRCCLRLGRIFLARTRTENSLHDNIPPYHDIVLIFYEFHLNYALS